MTGREAFDTHDEHWSHRAGDRSRKVDDMRPVIARRRSVTCRTLMRLIRASRRSRVLTQLHYDSTAPYAVSVLFNVNTDAPVEWVLGRDLMSAGRHELSGAGDVRVWPSEILDGVVFISLRSGAEMEVLAASARAIDTFVERTHQVVPPGEEEQHLDLDGVVRRLMDEPS
ncbi:SsgA family sporulation/cell division regulator [Streptomyces cadmiisoli]|uniref:SsgA family sporulation/cell division regulator n=1 Tax=Streptomyces cadmiisoli TaxID=2184053 RepID=A0A2Z4IS79_9ACTN|nr:SsgA family sporulation/cell division regulator [Streptomyces cadmiisoli]